MQRHRDPSLALLCGWREHGLRNSSPHTRRPELLWVSSRCELTHGAAVSSLWQPKEACLEEEA